MEERTDAVSENHEENGEDRRERFKRAIRGLHKPKTGERRPLRSITNSEKRERLHFVEQMIGLGMSLDQIADYASTVGHSLSRSVLYEYLDLVHVPRGYAKTDGQQSHHDYYTFRFFLRIAQDAANVGHVTTRLAKGKAPCDGARFIPDFKFEVGPYRFYMEMQLSDLTETRWSVKYRNYLKLRQLLGRPFRALFIIDQRGDLAYARAGARKLLERRPAHERDLLLFVPLAELKGPRNVATDPIWLTPWGKKTSLLQWLTPSGQKPAVPRQR